MRDERWDALLELLRYLLSQSNNYSSINVELFNKLVEAVDAAYSGEKEN